MRVLRGTLTGGLARMAGSMGERSAPGPGISACVTLYAYHLTHAKVNASLWPSRSRRRLVLAFGSNEAGAPIPQVEY